MADSVLWATLNQALFRIPFWLRSSPRYSDTARPRGGSWSRALLQTVSFRVRQGNPILPIICLVSKTVGCLLGFSLLQGTTSFEAISFQNSLLVQHAAKPHLGQMPHKRPALVIVCLCFVGQLRHDCSLHKIQLSPTLTDGGRIAIGCWLLTIHGRF